MRGEREGTDASKSETSPLRIVMISGMSGAGKTVALKTLEDLDYFCIDNLPSSLLDPLVRLFESNPEITKVALGMDGRDRSFPIEAQGIVDSLAQRGHNVVLLFLDASQEALIRRFAETRRPHPLSRQGSIADGVARERELLEPLRALAAHILDTSPLNVHQLKAAIVSTLEKRPAASLNVILTSFGFKYGLPLEAAFVFDVRYLPNPYFVEGLRNLAGTDPAVSSFVLADKDAQAVADCILSMVRTTLPLCRREGRSNLMIAVGCTGGQHRSVAIIESIAAALRREGVKLSVVHRDL